MKLKGGKTELFSPKKQREAIEESISNGVMVMTGGPGTGKTTIINAIIKYSKIRD